MLPPVRTHATHISDRGAIGAVASSASLFFVACTSMLGIDGQYVGDGHGHPSSGGAGVMVTDGQNNPAANGTGGSTFTGFGGAPNGGAAVGNGGIPIAVVTGGAGAIVAPPFDSGSTCPACPPAVNTCPSGDYAGRISGDHSASILAGFRIPISGTVTFSLTPDAAGAIASVNGKIEGSATVAPNSFAQFNATLTGSLHCDDGSMKGAINGTYAVAAGAPPVPFEGTHQGIFVNAAFEGTWSEHETSNPSMSQYFGTGTWTATAVAP
jgi:hypothetical protein